jgi:hypothetical protein
MNLSDKYYFKGRFAYKATDGETRVGMRYSYESARTLYDVSVYADNSVAYQINCQNCDPTPFHISIAAHFDVDLTQLHGSRVK